MRPLSQGRGRGGDAGPDLSKIGSREVAESSGPLSLATDDAALRQRAYLLQSLLAPDDKIAPGFASVTLRLADGRVVAGLVKAETPEQVDLQTPDGQILRILAADIDERTQPRSPMPPVEKLLTLRELRDLVEYLTTLR